MVLFSQVSYNSDTYKRNEVLIYLRAGFADKCSSNYSIYITFGYNPNYVTLIKTLKTRIWNNDKKWWEVPYDDYTPLISMLNQYGIQYNAEEFMLSIQQLSEEVEKMQTIQKQEANVDVSILDTTEFKTKPYEYQKEGIAYGLIHDRFLNADDQGLGKSLQCLNTAVLKRGGKHCLVIVGYKALLFNWVKEIETHTNEKGYVIGQRMGKRTKKLKTGKLPDRMEDIKTLNEREEFFLITDVTTLRQCVKEEYINKKGKKAYNKTFPYADALEEWCRKGEIGRIIFDEFQVCKNIDSDQTQALLRLKSAPYKIAATGTPIMNRNIDLYPLMVWLGYENRNYWQFRERYCKLGGYKGKEIIGDKNNPELNAKLSQFMIRRKKEDVLDLPEKIIIDELLELDGKQWSLYEKTQRMAKMQLSQMKGNKVALMASMLSMRKITTYPQWVEENITESVKFERALQIVYEAFENKRKTIIFSNWSTPINALYGMLQAYNPAMITGDTKDRMAEVEKFQNDDSCYVIIGTIGAMGTGLTLNKASNVIFLDEPWNRALKDQATDRAYRIGTKYPVNVYTLICKDTVDEGVHKTVYKKGRLADEIVDGVSPDELYNILENY